MTSKHDDISEKVRQANKEFYDIAAATYEQTDGRRTEEFLTWIEKQLKQVRQSCPGGTLLDLGCGSGIVMRCANNSFDNVFGIDISVEILKKAKDNGYLICGDGAFLPFADNSIDAVVCFAALHHLYDHRPVVQELYRVLKPGGIFYSDHDMSKEFSDRFKWPLKLYRYIFNAQRKYQKANTNLNKELYELTEIHESGIDQDDLVNLFISQGYSKVTQSFHWYGLSEIFNFIMGKRNMSKGLAPLLRIWVVK